MNDNSTDKQLRSKYTNDMQKHLSSKKQGLQILFGDDWHKWHYLQNQLSYVTPMHISAKIAQLAFHYYGKKTKEQVVWDMFGGLGMDAVNFSYYFKVIVTEIDPQVFSTLQINITTLCTNENKKIETLNVDALHQMNKTFLKTVNLIYFDPPWGNSFKTGEPFDFSKIAITTMINDQPVEQNIMELLDKLYSKVQNIIIKSPILSDSFDNWATKKGISILQICEFPTHKLKYLFLGS